MIALAIALGAASLLYFKPAAVASITDPVVDSVTNFISPGSDAPPSVTKSRSRARRRTRKQVQAGAAADPAVRVSPPTAGCRPSSRSTSPGGSSPGRCPSAGGRRRRAACMTALAAITPRGTALSRPSMTSATSSLYAVKFSFLSASYQTCASRYFWFGSSSAPAHARTLLGGVAVPEAVAVGEEQVLEAGDGHVVAVPGEVVSMRSRGGVKRDHRPARHYLSLVAGNDKRARDQDRDQAIEVVEAAWADGQIVEADRDKRVESLLQAQTMAEVQMLVHDLQLPRTPPPPRRRRPRGSRWTCPSRRRSRSAPTATWASGCCSLLIPIGLVAGVIAIIAATVSGVSTAIDEDDLPTEPGVEPGRGEVNVMSVEGLADLVAAIEEETGSSTVFEARSTPSSTSRSTPRRARALLLLGRRPRGNRQQEHDRLPALRPRRRRRERCRLHRRPGAGEGGGPAVVVLDHPRAVGVRRRHLDLGLHPATSTASPGTSAATRRAPSPGTPRQLLEVHRESGTRAPNSGLPESTGYRTVTSPSPKRHQGAVG